MLRSSPSAAGSLVREQRGACRAGVETSGPSACGDAAVRRRRGRRAARRSRLREKGTALTTTGTAERAWLEEPGAHRLLVADTDDQRRTRAAAWVAHQLARGTKIYYKGRLPEGHQPHQHWLTGPTGAPGAHHALTTGQLEFLDFPTVLQRSHGTTEGLRQLLTDECERAIADGWPTIAMSQESPHHPMTDTTDTTGFTDQEHTFDTLATHWPLTTLCQLTTTEETPTATWETNALHYRHITDVHWSGHYHHHRWHLHGALDAHIAMRFSAALCGALAAARSSPRGPDLHIDLSAVDLVDFACAQVLVLNGVSASHRQRVVLHHATSFVRHTIIAAGRTRTLLFDDETSGW